MSVPSITAASRITPTTGDALASAVPTPDRQSVATAEPEIDPATQQPKPPRFPWLTRLSQQLESAAQQRPSFPAAPVLGDNVDQSA